MHDVFADDGPVQLFIHDDDETPLEFARQIGSVLRLLQSGNIRSYATWVLFGGVMVIVALSVAGGIR